MHKLVELVTLTFLLLSIGACGRTGELTPVKQEEPVVAHQHHQQQMKEQMKEQVEPVQETLDFIPQSPK